MTIHCENCNPAYFVIYGSCKCCGRQCNPELIDYFVKTYQNDRFRIRNVIKDLAQIGDEQWDDKKQSAEIVTKYENLA